MTTNVSAMIDLLESTVKKIEIHVRQVLACLAENAAMKALEITLVSALRECRDDDAISVVFVCPIHVDIRVCARKAMTGRFVCVEALLEKLVKLMWTSAQTILA